MKLSKEMLDKIQEAAEKISYGTITISLIEHLDSVDIEISERVRVKKPVSRPGMLSPDLRTR